MTERPLRILIAADTYPPDVNGAAVFGYRLAQHMTARGHDVHIAAARPGPGPNTVEYQDEATIHRFRSFKAPTHEYYRLCLPWMIEPGMRRLVEELKPDVVHVQCHYMVGKAAILAAESARVRLIATNHFMPENLDPFLPFPRWFKNIVSRNSWRDMGRLMGKASVVTTPTPLAAATMKTKGGFDHVLPLSNGIDIDYYSPRPGEKVPTREKPTVLFVGRLAVEKNVEVLIDAVAKTNPDLQISAEIVGDGEQRDRLRDQVAELGIEDRITFRGHIDDDDLREAYLAADVFCQPGTAELQSLVSLEAMSAGKPVVLANALALPHLVTQGENGYLFEPNDSEDLAAQLNTIFSQSHQERTRMGEASRAKAAQHAIDQTMSAFQDLYQGSDWVHTGQFDNW